MDPNQISYLILDHGRDGHSEVNLDTSRQCQRLNINNKTKPPKCKENADIDFSP